MKLKPIIKKKMWCYIAPDGEIQTRSVQPTKDICREAICAREYSGLSGIKITYKDYEDAGYKLKRIIVTIEEV